MITVSRDIKLVITDLDGTLIDGRYQVSKKDLETLHELKQAGIPVVAATGRGKRSANGVTKNLPLSQYLVCFQGAALFQGEEVLWHKRVGDCLPFFEILREKKGTDVGVYIEHTEGVFDLSIIGPDYAKNADYLARQGGEVLTGEKLAAAASENLTKMVYFSKLHDLLEIESYWLQMSHDKHVVLSSDYTLELTNIEAKKSTASKQLVDLLGLSVENVLALGDNYNDVDLIEWAGVGVAMGSAPKEAKSKADFITKTVEESGFSEAIYKYVLK